MLLKDTPPPMANVDTSAAPRRAETKDRPSSLAPILPDLQAYLRRGAEPLACRHAIDCLAHGIMNAATINESAFVQKRRALRSDVRRLLALAPHVEGSPPERAAGTLLRRLEFLLDELTGMGYIGRYRMIEGGLAEFSYGLVKTHDEVVSEVTSERVNESKTAGTLAHRIDVHKTVTTTTRFEAKSVHEACVSRLHNAQRLPLDALPRIPHPSRIRELGAVIPVFVRRHSGLLVAEQFEQRVDSSLLRSQAHTTIEVDEMHSTKRVVNYQTLRTIAKVGAAATCGTALLCAGILGYAAWAAASVAVGVTTVDPGIYIGPYLIGAWLPSEVD